jgi:hypothetical protein
MVLPRHRVRLPDPAGHFKEMPRDDQEFFKEQTAALQRELDTVVRTDAPRWELLLYAPDESVWAVTVTNAGALVVARPKKRTTAPLP